MATQVLMPQLGEAVEEATITKWLKMEGDSVDEYEPLVEVNTDKVDTEIPSPASGTLLKILVSEEGKTVQVGTILAWIGVPGESIPDSSSEPEQEKQGTAPANEHPSILESTQKSETLPASAIPTPAPNANRDLGFISPVVSKIAAEHGVELHLVPGTGLNGRITKKDILGFIEAGAMKSDQPETPRTTPSTDRSTLLPHTTIRRRIADHMVMSKRTSPHVTTVFEADMLKVVEHRDLHKKKFAKAGTKLTFTAYFVAATASALQAFPNVNASWREEGLVLHRDINIGMATSLGEEGLIVPIIKNADELSLLGTSRAVNDLASRARLKQLQPDEVGGGTFTITNHGVSGSLFAMPIINQPQCAILGVGKLQKRVVVLADDTGYDTIAVRPMVYLTLTFDHRTLDGAMADYFLNKVVNTLENWK
jgi:2-oxoglutarate dehydrogenase E2 component (dihydrolipoamide succinyltransferase)